MKKVLLTTLAMIVSLVFMAGIANAANPKLKIEVNGQSIKAVVTQGTEVTTKVTVWSGSKKGREAYYYVWARSGEDFYFLQTDWLTWDPGLDILEVGSLPTSKMTTKENIIQLNLPPGDYVLYFGAFVDAGDYYDTIYLQVLPGNMTDGVCGSANGGTFASAPNINLCSAGTPSEVLGIGPWDWTCSSPNGGDTVCCSANKTASPTKTNGICGSANGQIFNSIPTANLCGAGTPGTVTLVNMSYLWECVGINGGDNACCGASKTAPPTPVNGVCGSANNGIFEVKPTMNLCNVGSPTTVTGSGPWNWTCPGPNGGTTATCSANKTAPPPVINGVCGSANGGTFGSAPTTNLCSAGTPGTTTVDSLHYYWPCSSPNGGSTASCTASKESLIPVGTIGDNWIRFKFDGGRLMRIYFNNSQVKANTTTSNSIAHPFHFGSYNGWTVAAQLIHNVDWGYIEVNMVTPIQVRFTYGGDNTGPQSGWSWVTNLTGSSYYKAGTNDFCINADNGVVTPCP